MSCRLGGEAGQGVHSYMGLAADAVFFNQKWKYLQKSKAKFFANHRKINNWWYIINNCRKRAIIVEKWRTEKEAFSTQFNHGTDMCPRCDVTVSCSLHSLVGSIWESEQGVWKWHFTDFKEMYMTSQHIIRVYQRKIFPSIYDLSIICRSREFSSCVYFKSTRTNS